MKTFDQDLLRYVKFRKASLALHARDGKVVVGKVASGAYPSNTWSSATDPRIGLAVYLEGVGEVSLAFSANDWDLVRVGKTLELTRTHADARELMTYPIWCGRDFRTNATKYVIELTR